MNKEFLYNFFRRHRFGVLATSNPDNSPECAVMGFASTPDLRIIFDTVNDSRKYRNIINNPNIAFVIGWEKGVTVQYEGIAKTPTPEELEKLLPVYFSVFPDGINRYENWDKITYFVVEPCWIRYSDYNQAPVEVHEMDF